MKKYIKTITIILIFIVLGKIIFAQNELDTYLQKAVENNNLLLSLSAKNNAAEENVKFTGKLPDPILNGGYFIMPIETREGPQIVKIGLSQNLPFPGSLKADKNSAEYLYQAQNFAYNQAKANLFYNVKKSYYELFYTKKTIEILNDKIIILQKMKKLAEIKFYSENASLSNQLKIELEINELEIKLLELNEKYNKDQKIFFNLINTPNDSIVNIPDSIAITSFTINKNEIMQSNYNIKNSNSQISAFEQKKQSVKFSSYPKISIGAEYTLVGNSDTRTGKDAFLVPKIGLSLPLNQKKYTSKINKAELLLQEKKYQYKNEILNTESEIEKNIFNIKDADLRLELYKKNILLSEKIEKLSEADYSVNLISFDELLRIKLKTFDYKLMYERAKTDKIIAIAKLQALSGKF